MHALACAFKPVLAALAKGFWPAPECQSPTHMKWAGLWQRGWD